MRCARAFRHRGCVCVVVGQAECFQALAAALTEYPPPEEQRLPLLNDAWRVVTRTEDAAVYTECVASFMGMLLKHYSVRPTSGVALLAVWRVRDECV